MVRAIEKLSLTEEESFALLELCLTSPTKLNVTSERALQKLANYCATSNSNHKIEPGNEEELERAV